MSNEMFIVVKSTDSKKADGSNSAAKPKLETKLGNSPRGAVGSSFLDVLEWLKKLGAGKLSRNGGTSRAESSSNCQIRKPKVA